MNPRWFISTVRHATTMRKHVQNILNAQRDILTPPAIEKCHGSAHEFNQAIHTKLEGGVASQMEKLEGGANKWLKPYPNANYRENIEVFLVALAVAMGIRTFFVQPFKIPTGSIKPTLFGVTSENLMDKPTTRFRRSAHVREWFEGISYIDIKAKTDGEVTQIQAPVGIRSSISTRRCVSAAWLTPFCFRRIMVRRKSDRLNATWLEREHWNSAGLQTGKTYRKGDQSFWLKVKAGDHLFVDRLTLQFPQTRPWGDRGVPDGASSIRGCRRINFTSNVSWRWAEKKSRLATTGISSLTASDSTRAPRTSSTSIPSIPTNHRAKASSPVT